MKADPLKLLTTDEINLAAAKFDQHCWELQVGQQKPRGTHTNFGIRRVCFSIALEFAHRKREKLHQYDNHHSQYIILIFYSLGRSSAACARLVFDPQK